MHPVPPIVPSPSYPDGQIQTAPVPGAGTSSQVARIWHGFGSQPLMSVKMQTRLMFSPHYTTSQYEYIKTLIGTVNICLKTQRHFSSCNCSVYLIRMCHTHLYISIIASSNRKLPVHPVPWTLPSPWYPGGQVQTAPVMGATLSVQVAIATHGSGSHPLVSVEMNIGIILVN